jgi:hypothetical protein
MFFYYTTNDRLMLDYVAMHPHLIYLDMSNHQQTAATNMAPSGDERARDASRAPSVRLLLLFLSLLTCIYNKIDYDCFQTFKHPHCDVSDHQRNSSRSSRGSDATVILFLFFLFISLIPINYSLYWTRTTTTKARRNTRKGARHERAVRDWVQDAMQVFLFFFF